VQVAVSAHIRIHTRSVYFAHIPTRREREREREREIERDGMMSESGLKEIEKRAKRAVKRRSFS
jgi:Glu-tRNA(Gln) amidotransferase subunit E-like FAD-binding protein